MIQSKLLAFKNFTDDSVVNGFYPWSGKISHAQEKPGPLVTTTEAWAPRTSAGKEVTTMRSLCTTNRE